MRKLIVSNMVSLDGYYEGPGGDVMVLPLDASLDTYSAQRMREADTLLLGHKTSPRGRAREGRRTHARYEVNAE